MTLITDPDPAAATYDRLAPYYDEFTHGYAHDEWVTAIDLRARQLGRLERSALDVACGTGKSTAALLKLGYEAIGCDISPEMVKMARQNLPGRADAFFVADMRALPVLGRFDLVLCLDDAVNYLGTQDDLEAAFASLAAVLSPTGILAFDTNSLATYRTAFAQPIIRESEGLFFTWRGQASADLRAGEAASATVEVFVRRDDGLWERHSSPHHQRHHPTEHVIAALQSASLECCAICGQLPGGRLEDHADEARHIKLVYFARHRGPDPRRKGDDLMNIISPR
jgi:SAM-dependent methyltransferase